CPEAGPSLPPPGRELPMPRGAAPAAERPTAPAPARSARPAVRLVEGSRRLRGPRRKRGGPPGGGGGRAGGPGRGRVARRGRGGSRGCQPVPAAGRAAGEQGRGGARRQPSTRPQPHFRAAPRKSCLDREPPPRLYARPTRRDQVREERRPPTAATSGPCGPD